MLNRGGPWVNCCPGSIRRYRDEVDDNDNRRPRSTGAFLITLAVLIIAAVWLANANRKGADDTPLEGDKTTSAADTQVALTPDLYPQPMPCDGFSEQVRTEILTHNIELNTIDGDNRRCVWETTNGNTVRVTTTWYPISANPDSAQKAQQNVVSGGVPVIHKRIGDGAHIYDCSGELCQIVFSRSNVAVNIIMTSSIAANPSEYAILLAENYAATTLTR